MTSAVLGAKKSAKKSAKFSEFNGISGFSFISGFNGFRGINGFNGFHKLNFARNIFGSVRNMFVCVARSNACQISRTSFTLE